MACVTPNLANKKRTIQGFTLIEMLIAIAIFSIMMVFVSPSIQSLLAKNKIAANINELSALIKYARFNAIDNAASVVVCPTEDMSECTTDWDHAKMAFIDHNNNLTRDSEENLIAHISAFTDNIYAIAPSSILQFSEFGSSNMQDSIALCAYGSDVSYARAVNINLQGRARVSKDEDNDGIHEDIDGANLSCD